MKYIALSFIGKLPEYTIYCIHQIRLYTDVEIFLIIDDLDSPHINKIKSYENINIVEYNTLTSHCEKLKKHSRIFAVVNGLNDRRLLFYRSFERFYLLYSLMEQKKLTDVVFIEIDNLIYQDPSIWTNIIDKDIAFMIDNIPEKSPHKEHRASTGLCFIRNIHSLNHLIEFLDFYLTNNKHSCPSEMNAIGMYQEKYSEKCFILPSYVNNKYIDIISDNFIKFSSLFDPSVYGIFLLGYDTHHTNGKIVTGQINKWGVITDLKNDMFIWKNDINGLRKPYFIHNNEHILINNLHVHSKDLLSGLSKPLE